MRTTRASALLLCVALLVLAAAGAAYAGAWTHERGHGLLILKTTIDRARKAFDDTGSAAVPHAFHKTEGQAYGEWGLFTGVTLIGAPTFQAVRDAAGGTIVKDTGFAFAEVGARVRLWQNARGVFSVQSIVILPGSLGESGNAVLGSGKTDYELRAMTGWNFTFLGRPGFFDLEGAFRQRNGLQSNEWRADATIGVRLRPRWQLLTQTFSTFGTGDLTLHKAQMSVVHDWSKRTSLELGAWRTLAGRNVVQEEALFASIWFRT